MVRAHWIDVGGMSTGFGAGPSVGDPWLEGLQLDQLKIYEAGKLNETLYRVLKDNIRFPESSLGDMKSQMAACRLAVRRMDELFDKYGRETILDAIAANLRRDRAQVPQRGREAEGRRLRGRLLPRPRRGASATSAFAIHAKVTVDRGSMTIDLSGCSARTQGRRSIRAPTPPHASPTRRSPARSSRSTRARSARSKVIIPEGNIMMARYPAPMAGWSVIVPTVVDTIVKALAPAMTDRVPAGASRAPWRRRRVLRRASEDGAALRGAEHRGRRLGRPAHRGRRIRRRSRSARATCATPRSKASS